MLSPQYEYLLAYQESFELRSEGVESPYFLEKVSPFSTI
jgi:hypothetical protein